MTSVIEQQKNSLPPTENILNYQHNQRAFKAFKTASGGLVLMASFLLLVGAMFAFSSYSSFSSYSFADWEDVVLFMATGVLPAVWFVFYFLCALLFQRRVLWAGWTALIMSVVHFGLICWGFVMSLFDWTRYSYSTPTGYLILASAALIAILVGFAAVICEVWIAVRRPIVWMRNDPSQNNV